MPASQRVDKLRLRCCSRSKSPRRIFNTPLVAGSGCAWSRSFLGLLTIFSTASKAGTLDACLLLHEIIYLLFLHFWLAMVQDVLQADWQDVWHSPQPPWLAVSFRLV